MLNDLKLESWCIYPDCKTFDDVLAFYFTSYNVKDEYNPYVGYNLHRIDTRFAQFTIKGWGILWFLDGDGRTTDLFPLWLVQNEAGLGSKRVKDVLNLTTDELYILVQKILRKTGIDVDSLAIPEYMK